MKRPKNLFAPSFGRMASLLIGLLLLSLLAACHSLSPADPGLEKVTLQLKWFHQFQNAGYYAALEQGFYREAGLEVTIVVGGPFDTYKEVLSGRAQYGVSNTEVLLQRLRGQPLVVLAAIFQHAPDVFMVRQDSGIENPQEFVGKRVWLAIDSRAADLQATLINEGVPLDAIDIVLDTTPQSDFLFDETIAAFGAYATNEPFYWAERDIPFMLIKPQTYGIDFYGDTLYTTETELENHPERVRRFREASLKGWEYAMAHSEEMVDLIQARYSPSKSRDHLLYEAEVMREYIVPELVEMGHMNRGRWAHIADTYAALGMVEPDYSLDGFIYDPALPPDYTWVYRSLGLLGGLVLLAGLSSGTLYIFNKRLQETVEQRTAALQRSEAHYRSLFDNALNVILIADDEAHYIEANPAACKLLGYTRQELLSKSLPDLTPAPIATDAAQALWQAFIDKGQQIGEMQLKTKTGHIIEIEYQAVANFLPGQHLSVLQDITERKRIEMALQKSEALHRVTLENIADPVFITNNTGDFTFICPNIPHLLGYSIEEVEAMGNMAALVGGPLFTPDQLARQTEIRNIERVVTDQAGQARTYLIDVKQVAINGGTALYTFRDITQRKQLEKHIRQNQRLETIGTLAGGIAHDFNNILTPIMGYTEFALAHFSVDHPARADLERVAKAALRAKELVRQILTFSRQVEQERMAIALQPLIKEVLTLLRPSLPATIDIRQDIAPDCGPILADPSQIHQVLMNLCTNAYQAMEQTGGVLTIGLAQISRTDLDGALRSTLEQEAYACLTVADTGRGMDAATLDRLFEPFFTTKLPGQGTGLGLSVVHGIVKSHNGAIFAKSQPAQGSKFELYFPIFTQPMPINEPVLNVSRHGSGEHILVVDDEPAIVEVINRWLIKLGYQVTTHTNSLKALELYRAEREQFDLVIIDLTMPHLTGLQLAREMAALRPDLPIILITGYNNDLSEAVLQQNGVNILVRKPIVFRNLNIVIRQLLN